MRPDNSFFISWLSQVLCYNNKKLAHLSKLYECVHKMYVNLFNLHTKVCKNTIEIFLYQCFIQHYSQQLGYGNNWCIQQQEWMNKICSIHRMVLFSATKNEVYIFCRKVDAAGHNHIEQMLSLFFQMWILHFIWIHKTWISMWHERRRKTWEERVLMGVRKGVMRACSQHILCVYRKMSLCHIVSCPMNIYNEKILKCVEKLGLGHSH